MKQNVTPNSGFARPYSTWNLEDAQAEFGELIRRAHHDGPQIVTVRGVPDVAIVDAHEFERLSVIRGDVRLPLVDFLEKLHGEGLMLDRTTDTGRDVDL